MRPGELRLGLDVGATNTDAVILDERDHVVAKVKVPSTPGARNGVSAAIRRIVAAPGVVADRVRRVLVASPQIRDAVREQRGLARVAVIRIGAPLTLAVPPLATWPPRLRRAVSAGAAVVGGGAEYNAGPGAALDEEAIARFLSTVAGHVDGVAITGVFAPVAPQQELAAADVVRRELGVAVPVSLSHEIGSLGLLERENATVLNAALEGVTQELAKDLTIILAGEGIHADLFFAQNDGTVMTLEHGQSFPVLMVGSGPAGAMRGAVYLSGIDEGVVLDLGGSETRVGVVVNGLPRESAPPALIVGVRVDLRMPDVLRVPIGGASVVEIGADQARIVPETVAHRALVFGGDTPTLLDAAVAGGRAIVGSQPLTNLQRQELMPVMPVLDDILADAVDRANAASARPPVVVVGGAGMLVPDRLAGAGEVLRPVHHDVANAVGVATAPVSARAERICTNRPDERARAVEDARDAAVARAIHAGADPQAVEVVELEEVPLTYLVDPAIRIRVRALGPPA